MVYINRTIDLFHHEKQKSDDKICKVGPVRIPYGYAVLFCQITN